MKILKPKYYLNTKLRSKRIDDLIKYPVYYRFNLNGSNHRIKSQLIDYVKNESELNLFNVEMERETLYLNTLFSKFEGNYQFFNFEQHFRLLNMTLYELYNSYYLSQGTANEDKEGNFIYEYQFSYNYGLEMAVYFSSKIGWDADLLFKMMSNDLVNLNTELPTSFVQDPKLLLDTEIHNILFKISNDSKCNLHDWFFDGKRTELKKFFNQNQFDNLNSFLNEIYKEIFEQEF